MPRPLTSDALESLLTALDPDRERAAIAYEQLRTRVTGLLRWWRAARPEELADETLDRVARKLAEGATIGAGSFGAYVRGVGRMVFYESTREPHPAPMTADPPSVEPPEAAEAAEAAADCLDRCLSLLPPVDRSVLLRYYDAGKAAEVRRVLAREAGVSPTALRVRTHRLRIQVERCVTTCMEHR
jgi:DNA-directed RNA polymerase specialized sigma24 family protein